MSFDAIAQAISSHTGEPFSITQRKSVGGGSINDAYVISDGIQHYFVKLNRPAFADMFAAEAEGLRELTDANAVRTPNALCWGRTPTNSYIVMDYIPMGRANRVSHQALGEQLARQHRQTNKQFGWHRDNTIGSTEQINTPHDDWIVFLQQNRIGFQLELAARNGYARHLQRAGDILLSQLNTFFTCYRPAPSLLHGDLWSGNYAFDESGQPVIFDPAVYYGDREADIAMTELFGGFAPEFYEAYNNAWKLDDGYRVRKTLYNLYHILNHVNLFGSGYLGQAERMLNSLLSEIK